jgi:hypothetical protein
VNPGLLTLDRMFMLCSYEFEVNKLGWRTVSLIHNERTKLTATLFNTMATAFVAAGLFAPVAAIVYGISDLRIGNIYIAGVFIVCGLGTAILHWIGRVHLGRLRE